MNQEALERFTAKFYDWELRGRGWREYPYRVRLEPAFVPFPGYVASRGAIVDDARKPGLLSSIFSRKASSSTAVELSWDEDDVTAVDSPSRLDEVEILMPADQKVDPAVMRSWLSALSDLDVPLSYELVGQNGRVSLRLAVPVEEVTGVRAQLEAFFPQARLGDPERTLHELWDNVGGELGLVVDFGLSREFMLPLRELPRGDPLIPIIGALASVTNGVALVQVLFAPARQPWAQSVARAVTAPDGDPFFLDAPELTKLAAEKVSSSLYAASVRTLVRTDSAERAVATVGRIHAALAQYGSPDRNSFVPLASENNERLANDILSRTTHRSGMILSLDELASFVRMPSELLRSPALVRTREVPAKLPAVALSAEGIVIGKSKHEGATHNVLLPLEARLQHTHVIGASGTGKSTFLVNLILQEVEAGRGVGVLDPHGDLVDEVLARVPEQRVGDVVLFDPSDPDWCLGWNILGANSALEKELLASDLVSVFRKASTSWGDQMSVVLANAVMAFLESRRGGTLIELRRFLLDDAFREGFLGTVTDDHVVSFWHDEWPLLVGKRPQAPILTRLDTFLRSRLVREAIAEKNRPLNFRAIMDGQKIFLAKLSQGAIGEENASFLGSLLVSKFHQMALSRTDTALAARTPFLLFVDECQLMATPSMAGLFSGVRKYRLGLTIAHQDLYQLHASAPDVERAALTNAYTRMVFRVSDEDARKLERGMGEFAASDLSNLGRGEAICRVGRRDDAFRLKTIPLSDVPLEEAETRRSRIRALSGEAYGRRRGKSSSHVKETFVPEPAAKPAPILKPNAKPSHAPAVEPEVAESSSPGRGGPMHKYLQSLVKEAAEAQGFKAEIERTIADGKRVDVFLSGDGITIACEIAGTTTIDQELGNLRKSLAFGCTKVCAISFDAAFLRKLRKAVDAAIESHDRERIELFAPEEFITFVGSFAPPSVEKRVGGYAVKVRRSSPDTADAERQRAITDVMLKSVRRMKEKQ